MCFCIHLPSSSINCPNLDNLVDPFGDHVASYSKYEQPCRYTDKPGQVAFVLLARNPDVHAPETGDDVHREDDCAQDGELAENICGLLLAFVHANIDLCEVIGMRPSQYSKKEQVSVDASCRVVRLGGTYFS